jgi:hypothetical protein
LASFKVKKNLKDPSFSELILGALNMCELNTMYQNSPYVLTTFFYDMQAAFLAFAWEKLGEREISVY